MESHPPHRPRRAGHAAVAADLDLLRATGSPKSPVLKPVSRMKLRSRRAKSPAPTPQTPEKRGVGFDGTGPPRAT